MKKNNRKTKKLDPSNMIQDAIILDRENPDPQNQSEKSLRIVAIGASAGGLEALRQTLPNLPEDKNIAYVIVQHMDPRHKSLLADLLTSFSPMPVFEIENDQLIEPNRIYITPPNKNLILKGKLFKLIAPNQGIVPKPSIDLFFIKLSETFGENTIGIILSGTGSDGANGIRAIKAAGGITISQTEETAKFSRMPQAAVDTGCIDLILRPEEIGEKIQDLIEYGNRSKPLLKREDTLKAIFSLLMRRFQVDFSEYKTTTVLRRIERRLLVVKVESLEAYYELLQSTPYELQNLFRSLLISVTSFFRDKESFDSLQLHLRGRLANKKPGDDIRVWVPACATGEEVYTIGMILALELGNNFEQYNIQIFGTDLDEAAINFARQGQYSESSLTELPSLWVKKFFQKSKEKFRVNQLIRDVTVFARHNIIREPPFSKLDLISCRNLLIYLEQKVQVNLMQIFHYGLAPGGLVFLGKSETIQNTQLFSTLDQKSKIYRRREISSTAPFGFRQSYRVPVPTEHKKVERVEEKSIRDKLSTALVLKLGLKAVVLTENLKLLHILGDVSGFMRLPQGDFSANIMDYFLPELRLDLRTLVRKCAESKHSHSSRVIRIHKEDPEKDVNVILKVAPLPEVEETGQDMFLVAIQDSPVINRPASSGKELNSNQSGSGEIVSQLQAELDSTRVSLQTATEELETANEEMQSLNEELQSSNEELQSSNEELETSNEELQSTNEELTTVNEELQVKTSELENTVQDLENLMTILGFGVFVLDKNLRITRFNSTAMDFVGGTGIEPGEVITSIPLVLNLPELRSDIEKCISSHQMREDEYSINNKLIWKRVFPLHSDTGKVIGVILTFMDVTEKKQNQAKIIEQKELLDSLYASMTDGIILIDQEQKIKVFNPGAREIFGKPPENFLINNWAEKIKLLDANKNKPVSPDKFPLRLALQNEVVVGSTYSRIIRGKQQYLEIDAHPVRMDTKNTAGAVMVVRDITSRIKYEQMLKHRISFEKIVASLSSQLLEYKSEDMDTTLERVLKRICEFSDTVKGAIYLYQDENDSFRNTHEWCEDPKYSTIRKYADIPSRDFGYFFTVLNENKPVVIGQPNDLDEDAIVERAMVEREGFRPMLLIPMFRGKEFIGTFGVFGKENEQREWQSRVVSAFKAIGNLLLHALLRRQSSQRLEETMDQLKRSNADLERFAYVASHDLQEPLRSVASYLELIQQRNPHIDEKTANYMNRAIGGAMRMKDMINGLLEYSRLTSQRHSLRVINLNQLINDVKESMAATLRSSKSVLKVEDLPFVYGMPDLLYRLFQNLLSNAIKFNDKEKPVVRIISHVEQEWVRISVEDNGIGMDQEYQEQAFMIFRRLVSPKKFPGTGMGLAICKKIISLHNGKIWFESELQKGTTFHILLKSVQKEEDTSALLKGSSQSVSQN